MGLKNGKDYILVVTLRGVSADKQPLIIAYETEHSISQEWGYDEVQTKNGIEYSPTTNGITISTSFRDATENTLLVKKLEEYGDARFELNVTEIDRTTLEDEVQNPVQFIGHVTNLEKSRPAEGGAEISAEYLIKGKVVGEEKFEGDFLDGIKETDYQYEALQQEVE